MFNREQMIEEINKRIESTEIRIARHQAILDDIGNHARSHSHARHRIKKAQVIVTQLLAALEQVQQGVPAYQIDLPLHRSAIPGVSFINNPNNPKSYNYNPTSPAGNSILPVYYSRTIERYTNEQDQPCARVFVFGGYTRRISAARPQTAKAYTKSKHRHYAADIVLADHKEKIKHF